MSNKHQNLEDLFRDALQNEEVAYDPSEWDRLSSQLDKTTPVATKPNNTLKWIIGTTIAAAMITGAIILLNSETNRDLKESKSTDQNVVSDNVNNNNADPENNQNSTNDNPGDEISLGSNDSEKTSEMEVITQEVQAEEVINDEQEHQPLQTIESLNHENNLTTKDDHKKEALELEHDLNESELNTTPEVNLNKTSICLGEEVVGIVENDGQFKTLEWYLEGRLIGSGKELKYSINSTGSNQIILIPNGSEKHQIALDINVLKTPQPTIQWIKSNPATAEVELYHELDHVHSTWYLDGKKLEGSENSNIINLERSGNYNVKVITRNLEGCESTTEDDIYILDDFQLLAPNAFTPDGDGINDNFIPKSLEVMSREFTMIIYDRTGNPVYQTSNIDMPWDGRDINTGKMSKAGSYVWTVKFKDSQQTYQGVISLIQ